MSTEHPNADLAPEEDPAAEDAAAEDAAQEDAFTDDDGVLYDEDVEPEYGIVGFTLRELLIVALWLVAFVTSFFPLVGVGSDPLWAQGIQWIIPIGIPTVAVFLIVLRRFSPDGIRRVGSLGIDQFASVAFSVAAVFWIQATWSIVAGWISTGAVFASWVNWVQLVATVGLVVVTVFAPIIPGLREDFRGRLVTLAHRNANPVRPVIARPRPVRHESSDPAVPTEEANGMQRGPSVAALDPDLNGLSTADELADLGVETQVPVTAHASGGDTGTSVIGDGDNVPGYARRSRRLDDADIAPDADLDATNPREETTAPQPFWALAPTERDVFDDRGEPLFRIGPSAWALVIEDRGGAYVIRHDDGRLGFLHDIADLTKG